jgi:putative FmdB family regulatory protein
MPLYEYRCENCNHQFEKIQRFSDDPITVCPSCGSGPVVKLLSSPAIQFKGSGWYITDYARKGGEKSSSGSTNSGAEKPEKTEKSETPASTSTPPSTSSSSSDSSSSTKKD